MRTFSFAGALWIVVSGRATPSSFSSKSFMKELEHIPRVRPPSSLVWLGLALPRVEAFCWLVISDKASTIDNLRKKGFVFEKSSEFCVLCRREKEHIDHLFVHCEFVHFLWC